MILFDHSDKPNQPLIFRCRLTIGFADGDMSLGHEPTTMCIDSDFQGFRLFYKPVQNHGGYKYGAYYGYTITAKTMNA
jgi:hypothetical protein